MARGGGGGAGGHQAGQLRGPLAVLRQQAPWWVGGRAGGGGVRGVEPERVAWGCEAALVLGCRGRDACGMPVHSDPCPCPSRSPLTSPLVALSSSRRAEAVIAYADVPWILPAENAPQEELQRVLLYGGAPRRRLPRRWPARGAQRGTPPRPQPARCLPARRALCGPLRPPLCRRRRPRRAAQAASHRAHSLAPGWVAEAGREGSSWLDVVGMGSTAGHVGTAGRAPPLAACPLKPPPTQPPARPRLRCRQVSIQVWAAAGACRCGAHHRPRGGRLPDAQRHRRGGAAAAPAAAVTMSHGGGGASSRSSGR